MTTNNLIECAYGHHMADKDKDFTKSGLSNIYIICRECTRVRRNKYRTKYRDHYNESKREYDRIWRANKRAQEKQNQEIALSS